MAKLNETSIFSEEVLRLDKDTPVLGYDEETGEIGPSNEQAQALANRTLWLYNAIAKAIENSVTSLNGKVGKLTITLEDLNGEVSGTASTLLTNHLKSTDPHIQYLNRTRGDYSYVLQSDANKPSGWVKLDSSGKLPAELMDALKARYVTVNTAEERLALTTHSDLTICAQLNTDDEDAEDQLFYLNANDDPSVDSNWIAGSSATLAGVSSTFGRTGNVIPQTGDYTADQITESENRVFLTSEERNSIGDKQDTLISGESIKTVQGKSLLGAGNIKITFQDVGADEKGTAETLVSNHENKTDPHTQYLTDERADNKYVSVNNSNKAGGWLQLDEFGNIPPTYLDLTKVRYKIVTGDEERLALPVYSNLTICAQLNGEGEEDDQIWYLNANLDPSVNSNWVKGPSVTASGVTSFFGRSGVVEPQSGDYNTDQITETENKVFVSPEEKAKYSSKQDKLESGKNIATVFGKSLLEGVNITLNDLENFNESVGAAIVAGRHIDIQYDETNKVVKIDAIETDDIRKKLNIISVDNATSKDYIYPQGKNPGFNYRAYGLREVVNINSGQISANYTSLLPNLPKTTLPTFDRNTLSLLEQPSNVGLTSNNNEFINSTPIDIDDVELLTIEPDTSYCGVVPAFTSITSNTEFTPISSKPYPGYEPWKAFQAPFATATTVQSETYWSDIEIFNNNKTNTWLGVSHATPVSVSAYQFQVTGAFALGSSTHIKSWSFQGRNSDTDEWVTIDTQVNQDIKSGTYFKQYYLDKVYSYSQYRVLITDVVDPTVRTSIPRFQLLYTTPFVFKNQNGEYFQPSSDGTIKSVTIDSQEDIRTNGCRGRIDLLPITNLKGFSELNIVAFEKTSVRLSKYFPSPQIVLHNAINASAGWLSLYAIIPSTFKSASDKDKIKYAITFDSTEWFSFYNGEWISLGYLTNNTECAKIINEKGMSYNTITNLTKDQLDAVITINTPSPNFGVAYATQIRNSSEATVPNIMLFNNDKVSSWVNTSSSEVVISIRKNSIVFRPSGNGNYKFCYEFIN